MFFFMIPIISKLCPIIRTFKWGIPASGIFRKSSVRQPQLPRFRSGRISAGNSSPTCRGRGLLADYVKREHFRQPGRKGRSIEARGDSGTVLPSSAKTEEPSRCLHRRIYVSRALLQGCRSFRKILGYRKITIVLTKGLEKPTLLR